MTAPWLPAREAEIRARLDAEDRTAVELNNMVDELLAVVASAAPTIAAQEKRITDLEAELDVLKGGAR